MRYTERTVSDPAVPEEFFGGANYRPTGGQPHAVVWLLHLGRFGFWAWFGVESRCIGSFQGVLALVTFAFLLTRIDALFAGRAYAAYGGVYIVASVLWLWSIEGVRPDRWDMIGAAVCLFGAAIILLGPRPVN